ncbi:MAG TPA: serine/threonine-protein kinase, partial [Gemmataceae bacterium]
MNTTASPENASVEALLSQITDEFLARLDAGEQPDIEEYVQRYPALADVLRQVLPALTVLRQPPSAGEAPADGLVSGVLGDFRIVREVGRGGMGVVYEAEQISLGRRVALKVLPFAATMDARQLQRFHNEARAAAGLHQEHIVPVHAVGCERGIHFYAMQFIEGRTLAELIEQQRAPGGCAASEPTAAYTPKREEDVSAATVEVSAVQTPPPEAAAAETPAVGRATTSGPIGDGAYFRRVAEWGEQAAEALEYAHSVGIVHRDVKPANLMVDSQSKLWVTDFGLARTAGDSGLTMTGDLLGTLRYMSPEQALAKHGLVDHRTDVYSLGVTLYELLTLRPAVDGKDRQEILKRIAFEEPTAPRSLNSAVPHELETIVLKAMAKEPSERCTTAKELADDLCRFLEDKPVLARRPSLMQRARRWTRRNRSLVGSLGAGLLLAAVALGGSVGWAVRDRAARQDEAERRVSEALAEMEPALRVGNPYAPDLVRAARQAESHLASNLVGAELRERAEQLLADLAMLEELELI